ncbi:chorismate-binding protein [Candidatus Micrarchaeota archaeon]|nr:chorismate-binding protein [Candidatus Micrarchaeota archaeon]
MLRVKSGVIYFRGEEREEDPFSFLKTFCLSSQRTGFRGGLVGYLSHDSIRYIENITPKKGTFPDMEFGLYLDGIVFDHLKGKARYVSYGDDRTKEFNAMMRQEPEEGETSAEMHEPFFTKAAFCESVLKAKERIAAGDAFQIVLSRKFPVTFRGSKMPFYKALRERNPSPYQYFLKMGKREIVGSSPEMLVRVEEGKATTFPIAGTRPRGKTGKWK